MLNVALREDDRIFYCRIQVEFDKSGIWKEGEKRTKLREKLYLTWGCLTFGWLDCQNIYIYIYIYIYKGENERVLNGRRVLSIINVRKLCSLSLSLSLSLSQYLGSKDVWKCSLKIETIYMLNTYKILYIGQNLGIIL